MGRGGSYMVDGVEVGTSHAIGRGAGTYQAGSTTHRSLMQKHLTFSTFPCTIPQGVSAWLRRNVDPLEDTEIKILTLLLSITLLAVFDQTDKILQFLDSMFRVALVALVAIRRELLEPETNILFRDVEPLGIGLQA